MGTRTIALDSKNLEGGIEALSSASRPFQLTSFERLAYRALMVSVDVAAWGWVLSWMFSIIFFILMPDKQPTELTSVSAFIFAMSGFAMLGALAVSMFAAVVATVFLALNFPLIRKLYRERARLKELGLSSLSKSLWKESRRSRWISRAHGALLILIGIQVFLAAATYGYLLWYGLWPDMETKIGIFLVLFFAGVSPLIFSARYLHNQRERMELAASAEELKKAFEGLRQRAGKAEVVSVPSELLEQAVRIESAQIAKERKDAVLQSIAVRPSGYAITFDRDAAKERATLGVTD